MSFFSPSTGQDGQSGRLSRQWLLMWWSLSESMVECLHSQARPLTQQLHYRLVVWQIKQLSSRSLFLGLVSPMR